MHDEVGAQNALEQITSLAIGKDYLGFLRMIMSYPLVNFAGQYFTRHRNAEEQLQFVALCRSIIGCNKEQLSASEIKAYENYLICSELVAYDRLNEFEHYIKLYEYAKDTKACEHLPDGRYQVVLRKKAKQDLGKLPKTMLRHQRDSLSEAQLDKIDNELHKLLSDMAVYIKKIGIKQVY